MGINEMSQWFDVLYNQVNSNQAASIDEVEKSIFLTKGQEELIKAYFDRRGNKFLQGFDDGQKRQYDFSTLIKHSNLTQVDVDDKYDPRSLVYLLPSDMFLPLLESVVETSGSYTYIYQVIPISYEQYHVLMQKPYKYPQKNSVWRLIMDKIDNEITKQHGRGCEIIGRFKTDDIIYKMRYVKKPYPIILVNLDNEYNGMTIDGFHGNSNLQSEANIAIYNSVTGEAGIPCYLPENMHHEVVQRAVELATASYNPQALGTITGVGNVSETNLGIIPRQESK